MKKYLLIMLACFSIIFTANADGNSCPVYGTQYTATIAHGSTMVSSDSPYVNVVVEGTKKALGYGDQVKVWINALDRSTGCIVDTAEVTVFVEGGKTRGSDLGKFSNLPKSGYYKVRIDRASCK